METWCRPAATLCGRPTGQLLAEQPDREYEIPTRIRVGSWVVDEERVTGGPRGEVRAIAIYHLDSDGLIDRARFLV